MEFMKGPLLIPIELPYRSGAMRKNRVLIIADTVFITAMVAAYAIEIGKLPKMIMDRRFINASMICEQAGKLWQQGEK